MKVAIIIPHKGREEMLHQTLQSIADQEYDLKQVEVYIASQNQKPIDVEVYKNRLPHLSSNQCDEHLTISALRNIGARNTSSDYLAFLDADVELSPNWLSAMEAYLLEDTRRVISSAIQRCEEAAPPLEKLRTVLSNAEIDCNVRFLPGRNLFISRNHFDRIGGFPEHLTTCEDYYFTDQANQQGDLYYGSRANYVHLGEDKRLDEMFKKEIWRGKSNLLSLKGRRIPLQEVPSFLVPIWILGFSVLALAGLITWEPGLVFACLLLALFPVALYSLRLYKLAKGEISFRDIFSFYITYFPARIIGTLSGLKDFARN